jgi:hypothetical protein
MFGGDRDDAGGDNRTVLTAPPSRLMSASGITGDGVSVTAGPTSLIDWFVHPLPRGLRRRRGMSISPLRT